MRVAIVNDMAMAREVLKRIIESAPTHRLIWMAKDGQEAVTRAREDPPDIILMDLIMPVMDGVQSTRQIMKEAPCAILIVTSTVSGNFQQVYDAMGYGALDAVNTPVLGASGINGAAELLNKLDLITSLLEGSAVRPRAGSTRIGGKVRGSKDDMPLLLLGASTGGPQALAEILSGLPSSFPAAIAIAQHVDVSFADGLAAWLSSRSNIEVRAAREGDRLATGRAFLAASNDHLVINANRTLSYTPSPRETPYRPSVDVLFFSVARHWQGPCCAALLTGMGRDGAEGLHALQDHHAFTIAQDQDSCVVFGMPRAAISLNAAKQVLSLSRIGPAIREYFKSQPEPTPCPTTLS